MAVLNTLVDLPKHPHKYRLTRSKYGVAYVQLEVGREYLKDKKYNIPKRVSIGRLCEEDKTKMYPNQRYFDLVCSEDVFNPANVAEAPTVRSHSRLVQVGSHIVIKQCVDDLNINLILKHSIEQAGLQDELQSEDIIDLAVYSIVTQSNKALHYENYAYNHFLFNIEQRILSGPDISKLLPLIDADMQLAFLEDWNKQFKDCKDVVIGYDSTNKNCQAGDIEIVEYGHAKIDVGSPVFNIAMATSLHGCIPLFYEAYGGSIPDVSQLEHFINKLKSYGYKYITLVLDRGYFSAKNFELIDNANFNFVMMVKGNKKLTHNLIDTSGVDISNAHSCTINGNLGLRGKTFKREFLGKDRYFHLFFSLEKCSAETRQFQIELERQETLLKVNENKEIEFTDNGIQENFNLVYAEDKRTFLYAVRNNDAIAQKLSRCGFFCIVTSKELTAEQAYTEYTKRDTSEKLFCADKTFLGAQCARVHSQPSLKAVIFIHFIALIIRSRLYRLLKDESIRVGKNQLHLNVPKAIKELDKIEVLQPKIGQPYTLSSAINSKSNQILNCFGISKEEALKQIKVMCNNPHLYNNFPSVKLDYGTSNELYNKCDEFEDIASTQGLDSLEAAINFNDDDESDEVY